MLSGPLDTGQAWLQKTPLTPVERFYVRSHLPVPATLDAAAWRLAVDGEVETPLSLSEADLRALFIGNSLISHARADSVVLQNGPAAFASTLPAPKRLPWPPAKSLPLRICTSM